MKPKSNNIMQIDCFTTWKKRVLSKTQHRQSRRPVTGQESVCDMWHRRTGLCPQGGEQELTERWVNAMKRKRMTNGEAAILRCPTSLIRKWRFICIYLGHQKGVSLAIKKTAQRVFCLCFLLEWKSSKNQQTLNAREGVEKKEPFCTVGGNENWYNHCGEYYEDSLRNWE